MCKRKQLFYTGLMFILTIIFIGWSEPVQSQEKYPSRAIDVIVPVTPGGSTDMSTRVVANFLKKKWGMPINVINKPGANNVTGTLELYRAAPNGYTMFGDNWSFLLAGFYVPDLPYKILDRTFIAVHSDSPYVIAVPASSPYKTLGEVINEVKKNPEKIAYTSRGGGGVEFAIRQFYDAIGVDINKSKPIMSRGGSEAATLTAGGHVTVGAASASSFLPSISGGVVRPLLVTSKKRFPMLPDVPTSTELGYPSISCSSWNGVSGPPNLSPQIAEIWDKAIEELVKDPEYIEQLKKAQMVPLHYNMKNIRPFVLKEMDEANRLLYKVDLSK